MKNLTTAALAAFVLIATTSSVMAQGEEDPFDPAADDGASADPYATEPSTTEEKPATSSSADGELEMGISVPLFRGFDLGSLAGLPGVASTFQTAKVLYSLDADTWLNLSIGLNFANTADGVDGMGNPIEGETSFGLALGVGYRMYKPTKGKIRPYLEPSIALEAADIGELSDQLGISLGALMGIDYALWEQFTIGAGIGARLNMTNTFDNTAFNLFTADINATFWW